MTAKKTDKKTEESSQSYEDFYRHPLQDAADAAEKGGSKKDAPELSES